MAQAQPKHSSEEMEVLVASPEASAVVPNSLTRVGIAVGALGLVGVAAAVAAQSLVFQLASVAGITSKEQIRTPCPLPLRR